MLAAAGRKRRRREPTIQPRQSASHPLQAPSHPVSHSPASGLRQGGYRACEGMTKNHLCCCSACCCCSYSAVLPCASAVSDHAALCYRIIKIVVGNYASIQANDCASLCIIIRTESCGEKHTTGALVTQHQCCLPTM